MSDASFLSEFLTVLVTATLVAAIFERFRLPSLLGFLLAGIALGPHGFGWLSNLSDIKHMAELGVVLLMLTIGLEFSFDRFRGLGKLAVIGGGLQLLLSILLGIGFSIFMGWTIFRGIFLGSVMALSSTAIVLKYLMDKGELDTQHGSLSLAILLFQDLAVVPLMIFVKGYGASQSGLFTSISISFVKAFLLLGAVVVFSKYILPFVLRRMAASRNREVFFLTSVVICLGTSWIGGQLGLSYAIGAFFAGVMFANTEYGHQLMGEIIPFRHIFVSIFFVSIGILFNIHFALEHIMLIMTLVGLVMVVNFVVMSALIMLFGFSPRIALASGMILSQIGEFSFLLMAEARSSNEIDLYFYQILISVAFMTMFFTPFIFMLVPSVLKFTEKQKGMGVHPSQNKYNKNDLGPLRDHVILCGFGPIGNDLGMTFKEENIPVVLIEMSPGRIHEAKKQGMRVIYGDAANREVMVKAGIDHAKMVVVSFGDAIGMAQIIRVVEQLNPDVQLFVRTRFERDVARLYHLGADSVIVEEWEASHEMHRLVLDYFDVPTDRAKKHLQRIHQRKELIVEESILRG